MSRSSFTAACLLILALATHASPGAACALDIDLVSSPAWSGKSGRGYDVFDATSYFQPVTFRVHSETGGCAFFATASAGANPTAQGALAGPGGTLKYVVYRDATGTQTLHGVALATGSDVLPGVLAKAGDTATFQIAYGIAARQVVGPGLYSGQITVTAYEGELGSAKLLAEHTVPVTVMVPSVAETSFSDGLFDPNNGIFNLNFNTMHQGEIKGVTLRTRCNNGYRVLAHSQHNGAMRHIDPSDNSTVKYRMTVDGKTAPLGADDTEVAARSQATDSMGKSHRIDFEIGDIAGASAGDYWDIVSVTIIAM